jgi:transposase-like protein
MQRNRYPSEFKEQALSKARQRGSRTLESIAGELNLSLGTLKGWLKSSAGARQGSCRLVHAANGCLGSAFMWALTTESRSGLRVTAPMSVQLRVAPDQRAGFRSRARIGPDIEFVASRQEDPICAAMTLGRGDVADAAVAVLIVVPTHEFSCPGACGVEVGEAPGRELRTVLGGAEQRLRIGVVIAHAGPRVRRLDAQPVQHSQHRGGLQRGAVVAVQHGCYDPR